jgi:hypothetical protein
MSAVDAADAFCGRLTSRGIRYQMDIVRDSALMVSLAVPGQRWEIEFHDDGTMEIERFVTTGVEACSDPLSVVLEHYE